MIKQTAQTDPNNILNSDVSPSPGPDSNVLHLACASLRGILGVSAAPLLQLGTLGRWQDLPGAAAAAWDIGALAGPSRLAPGMPAASCARQ